MRRSGVYVRAAVGSFQKRIPANLALSGALRIESAKFNQKHLNPRSAHHARPTLIQIRDHATRFDMRKKRRYYR